MQNVIEEFPYTGVITRTVYGDGDNDDTVITIYDGVMDETVRTDNNEGRALQTAAYIISIPLIKNAAGEYAIPLKGDEVTVRRYGQTLKLTVDNAEPSQLDGVSIYCTRKKW